MPAALTRTASTGRSAALTRTAAGARGSSDERDPVETTITPPSALVATAGNTEVAVTWGASSTTGLDAYHLETSTTSASAGFTEAGTVSGLALAETLTGLTNSVQVWVRIRARKGALYSDYVVTGPVTPTVPAQGPNAIAPGALQLFETFDSIGVYLPYTNDDNADATVTMAFSDDAGATWRDGLPLLRVVGTDAGGSGSEVRYWTGSVLFCDPGTTYRVRLTVSDHDGVNGATTITGIVTTRSESEIPDFAAMLAAPEGDATYPKRYVVASGGVTTGNARTAATAWTLAKAMSTDADSTDYFDARLNNGAGGYRMLVQLAPGLYDGPFTRTKTTPVTLLAENPAITYSHDDNPKLATWTEADATDQSIIRQPAARRSAPGDGRWTPVTLTGPGYGGATAGVEYDCYRWTGTINSNLRFLATSATETGTMTDIPYWKWQTAAGTPLSSPAGWIEFLNTNQNWNVPQHNAFGFYVERTTGNLYLRLQGSKALGDGGVDPDTLYVEMCQTGSSQGSGVAAKHDSHVYGLTFRNWERGVNWANAINRTIVDSCLFHSGRWGVYDVGTSNAPPTADVYGSKCVVQYCKAIQTSRWRTSTGDESTIEWNVVKQQPIQANGSAIAQNRNCEFFESTFTFGTGGSQQRTIRYNYVSGYFNGIAEAQNNLGGVTPDYDRWASAYQDVYGNFVRYAIDEAFEPEGQIIESRYWNNWAEHCSCFFGVSSPTWGNLFVVRNAGWRLSNHGSRPPGNLTLDSQEPGMTIFKYASDLWPQGCIHVYHNTIWTDISTTDGAENVGFHGPTQLGGGGQRVPGWYLKNNIWRVTGLVGDGQDGQYARADIWREDYNVWVSAADATTGIATDPVMRLNGSGNYTTPAEYRAAMTGNPAGWKAEHTNTLGATDYAFNRYDVVDALLNGPTSGDLTLKSGSLAINAGDPVPNVSDRAGVDYQGSRPDLGWKEKA